MLRNKFVRILLILLIIHIAWSICINLMNLGAHIDNEALVPCLFYLPPLGFMVLGLLAVKIIESVIAFGFMKKIFRRKKSN